MQKRMKKNNKKIKPDAVKRFKDACNDIAEAVNKQLFDGSRKWYWVGDEVGGACDFEEADVLNPDDMVRIIENRTTYDEYAEWRDANLDHAQYINLKSWLMGARHEMFNKDNDYENETSEEDT
nr:MAG TPA: hypothetical protein [Bacteriophage sp.]